MQLLRMNDVFFLGNEYAVRILVNQMRGAILVILLRLHSCVPRSDHTKAIHTHEVKKEKVFSG